MPGLLPFTHDIRTISIQVDEVSCVEEIDIFSLIKTLSIIANAFYFNICAIHAEIMYVRRLVG